jgi:heat shock protein HslJ
MSALDGTSWALLTAPDLDLTAEVTVFFGDGLISGSSGCNRFHGRYEATDSTATDRGMVHRVKVGPLASTMMMCEPAVMELEREVLHRLGDATAAEVVDGQLTLAADGAPLLTFRAQRGRDLMGLWDVVAIHWPDREAIISVATEHAAAPLTVNIDEDRVSGSAGCNSFNGRLVVDDRSQFRVGPLVSTMKACADEVMVQEQAMFRALERAVGYRLDGTHLTLLRDDGGISLSLRRA